MLGRSCTISIIPTPSALVCYLPAVQLIQRQSFISRPPYVIIGALHFPDVVLIHHSNIERLDVELYGVELSIV